MKAVLVEEFGRPEHLVVRDIEPPRPGPGEILVEVAAASLNFPDVLVVAGNYQILPELPFVPGKELAGVVTALGEGVDSFAVGDRVAAQIEHGAFAAQVVVPESLAVPVPDGLELATAATAGLVYVTAYYALRDRAQLKAGEVVLVTGATGGVGAAAVQLAKAWGATVIATASDEEGSATLRSQGADHVVSADPATLRDEVRRVTDGRGVDVAVEAIGGEVFSQTLRCMAWQGRLVVVGFASGDVPMMKVGHVLVKNISVTGLQVSDYRDRDPKGFSAVISEILDLIDAGQVQVKVAARYPLEETPRALGLLAGRVTRGRVVVQP